MVVGYHAVDVLVDIALLRHLEGEGRTLAFRAVVSLGQATLRHDAVRWLRAAGIAFLGSEEQRHHRAQRPCGFRRRCSRVQRNSNRLGAANPQQRGCQRKRQEPSNAFSRRKSHGLPLAEHARCPLHAPAKLARVEKRAKPAYLTSLFLTIANCHPSRMRAFLGSPDDGRPGRRPTDAPQCRSKPHTETPASPQGAPPQAKPGRPLSKRRQGLPSLRGGPRWQVRVWTRSGEGARKGPPSPLHDCSLRAPMRGRTPHLTGCRQ